MKLDFRNLPIGNLPYDDINLCKQMMLKLYEKVPFLAELPKMNANDNIVSRTFDKIPGITLKEKKFLLPESESPVFTKYCSVVDKQYNELDTSVPKDSEFNSTYFKLYLDMLARIKPKNTVIRLLGAYSMADMIFNQNTALLITDRAYRKFLIQVLTLKAFWFIKKIKQVSPNTKPLILFEEPFLYKFGSLKRANEEITNDTMISLFSKLFSRIQKAGAYVGVQSFEKCNWQLVLDANADLISFDAYNNTSSLNIIAEKINYFLAKGGYINWGIIPIHNEAVIKALNFNHAFKKFIDATEELNSAGVSLDLIYKNCTVSTLGNLAHLSILFAEKALILENQIAKKIPASSAR